MFAVRAFLPHDNDDTRRYKTSKLAGTRIFSPLPPSKTAAACAFSRSSLVYGNIIHHSQPCFTEKKLRGHHSQLICLFSRSRISPTKPVGSNTFTHGPNDSTRI